MAGDVRWWEVKIGIGVDGSGLACEFVEVPFLLKPWWV